MATAQPKYDPSMDELLTSIRRIISEDDQPAAHVQSNTPDYGFSEAFDREMAPQDEFPGLDPSMLPDLIEQSIREAFPLGDPDASGRSVGEWGASEMEAFSAALAADELGYDDAGHGDRFASPANAGWDARRRQAGESHNFEPLSRPGGRDGDFTDAWASDVGGETFAPDAEEIRRLLSGHSEETVGSSFDALARSVDAPPSRGLEDVVQDCLRPMLRTWLDQNLPPIVERMVQQEIARVSRRR